MKIIAQQKVQNELKPGRILCITYKKYNRLAILLNEVNLTKPGLPFTVITLLNNDELIPQNENNLTSAIKSKTEKTSEDSDTCRWHKLMSLMNGHFSSDGLGKHEVLSIGCNDILEITRKTLKVKGDEIVKDYKQRLIPRYSSSSPSSSVLQAITELKSLSDEFIKDQSNVPSNDIQYMLSMSQSLELVDLVDELKNKRVALEKLKGQIIISNFEEEFKRVFERENLINEINTLKYKLSKESLSLYPDYQNKLKVLQDLKYIDELHQVTMKGRVACEMSQNELIITELVLRNILTDLQPAEIAALLSSLVFQDKNITCNSSQLTPSLLNVSITISACHEFLK